MSNFVTNPSHRRASDSPRIPDEWLMFCHDRDDDGGRIWTALAIPADHPALRSPATRRRLAAMSEAMHDPIRPHCHEVCAVVRQSELGAALLSSITGN